MNKNPILPTRIFFFPPLLYPKIFPPPTYHLPPSLPTSPLLPTTYQPLPPSLHRQSSRNIEREPAWSWSRSCWSRSLEPGVGAGPTRYRGKPFSFLFFLQCNEPSSSIFFLLRCSVASLLLLFVFCCAAAQPAFFIFFCCAALQRSSAASLLHFFLLRCAAMLQRSQPSSFPFFLRTSILLVFFFVALQSREPFFF